MNSTLWDRLIILAVLVLTFTISAVFRKRARNEGGVIKRQEEGWLALTLRMGLALPLLLVILLNIIWPDPLSWAKFNAPQWLRILGLALAVICVPFFLWVFSSIGNNISETILIKDEHELVTHGPYHWIRHPLYGGALLMLLSISLVFGDWIILGYAVAGILAFRLLVIPAEEKQLLDAFGEEYECYQARTGALLPWIR
jgi:protein-S-isoprenylcysteine O-methyltransferase Ste14